MLSLLLAAVSGLSLMAGVMFGGYLALLAQPSHASGAWPLDSARIVGIVTLLVGMRVARVPLVGLRQIRVLSGVSGTCGGTANALYLVAVHSGMLSIAAPIAAMYPASTVILAMLVDRERMRPIQIAGLGLAATALVLTAG